MPSSSNNAFARGVASEANLMTGENGALRLKTSNDLRVDYFTNILQDTTTENVHAAIDKMLIQCASITDPKTRGLYIRDVFVLMLHKRGTSKSAKSVDSQESSVVSDGEGMKRVYYDYFLRLYDEYPDTVISLVKSMEIFKFGYWKDAIQIWTKINGYTMSDRAKYIKYNPLILALREAILVKRVEDLRKVYALFSEHTIKMMNYTRFKELVDRTRDTLDFSSLELTFNGKWLVREGSSGDKKAYWYRVVNGSYIKESHVNFMIRHSLKRKNPDGSVTTFSDSKDIPFGAKKIWRLDNMKLNTLLDVPEVHFCAKKWSTLRPGAIPSVCLKRNTKGLLNEMRKGTVDSCYEDTGNRYPEDEDRVACRRNMIDHLIKNKKVNSSQLFPHQIIGDPNKNVSSSERLMNLAMWKTSVEETRKKIADTLSKIKENVDESTRNAMSAGNFIGCADTSASMTWVGKSPNRPYDVAIALTAFMSEVASPTFRNMAMSFSTQPQMYSFAPPADAYSRIHTIIGNGQAGSTNYLGLHTEMLRMCKAHKVPQSDLPVLVIFSDGEFNSMVTVDSSHRYGYGYGHSNSRNARQSSTTTHQNVIKMWLDAGYEAPPTIVYWNLAGNKEGVQVHDTMPGVQLMSGPSPSNIKYVIYGETADTVEKTVVINGETVTIKTKDIDPYQTVRLALDQEYFDTISNILSDSNEKLLKNYTFDPSVRDRVRQEVSSSSKHSKHSNDWDYNVV